MRQAIVTKYIGPTNHFGARVSAMNHSHRIVTASFLIGIIPGMPTRTIALLLPRYPKNSNGTGDWLVVRYLKAMLGTIASS